MGMRLRIREKTVIGEREDAVANGSGPMRSGDRVEKGRERERERERAEGKGDEGGKEEQNAERISGGQKASGAIE